MRRDQLDAIRGGKVVIEAVAVVRLVADQSRRELSEESRGERRVDKGDFMRRSAGHVDGERKTMAVANRHDFAALTAASRANDGAPFFAELKLASMNASLRSSFPRSRRSSASRCKTRSNWPLRCQAESGDDTFGTADNERAGRATGAPVRSTHRTPFKTARVSFGGRPRPSGVGDDETAARGSPIERQ